LLKSLSTWTKKVTFVISDTPNYPYLLMCLLGRQIYVLYYYFLILFSPCSIETRAHICKVQKIIKVS
jgi:hypothetical protein